MITLQHAALYFMAVSRKSKETRMSEFTQNVPFVLLPDALRAYIPERSAGHFEETANGEEGGWMVYPSESEVLQLSKENASTMIKYRSNLNMPKCVIGEKTSIEVFDRLNWGHKHYHTIRIHLLQDVVMDSILRDDMVDVSRRFEDVFVPYHNSDVVINGNTLRDQINLFEWLGFIKLVGAVYNSTGVLLNREWYDEMVLPALLAQYPYDLAMNTYKYMRIWDEMNDRINSKEFELTEEERKAIIITDKPEALFNKLYSLAYRNTYGEL